MTGWAPDATLKACKFMRNDITGCMAVLIRQRGLEQSTHLEAKLDLLPWNMWEEPESHKKKSGWDPLQIFTCATVLAQAKN